MSMQHSFELEVVGSERLDNGIVVTFSDGRSLFYSAALLDATSSQARDLTSEDLHDTGK
jgi:hypothetical protein